MKMKKFKEMLKKEITQVLKEFWPVVMAANQGDLEQSQSEAVKAPTSTFSSTSGKKYLDERLFVESDIKLTYQSEAGMIKKSILEVLKQDVR